MHQRRNSAGLLSLWGPQQERVGNAGPNPGHADAACGHVRSGVSELRSGKAEGALEHTSFGGDLEVD